MNDPLIIDSHHHVWDLEVRSQDWTKSIPALDRSFTFDELIPDLDTNGVSSTIVVQTLNVADETLELLALAESNARIQGVVGWVDLRDEQLGDVLDRLKSRPGSNALVGIRHNAHLEQDDWISRAEVGRGLAILASHQLTFDVLVHTEELPSVIQVVKSLPDQRFILDHFGKPPIARGQIDPWRDYVRQLSKCENVAVKLSGLVTEAEALCWQQSDFEPYFDVILNEFGPERMMFGSDWPVCLVVTGYSQVVELARGLMSKLSPSEHRLIFGETAARWYGLR